MNTPLPSYQDVAPGDAPWCLEAAEHYFGKTLEEAEALFDQGIGLDYVHDLYWMAPAGFRFYVQAPIRWCLSDRSAGAQDASEVINSLAGTLILWRDSDVQVVRPCARLFADFCTAVVERFELYDVDPNFYPGLREKYVELACYFNHLDTAS